MFNKFPFIGWLRVTHWTAADYWGKQTHRDTIEEKNTTTGFSHENLSVFTPIPRELK